MEPEYSINDLVATVYDYDCNSGRVIDVSWFDSDTGARVFEYLVRLDVDYHGDGDDKYGNEVVFQSDELTFYGFTQDQMDEILDETVKL